MTTVTKNSIDEELSTMIEQMDLSSTEEPKDIEMTTSDSESESEESESDEINVILDPNHIPPIDTSPIPRELFSNPNFKPDWYRAKPCTHVVKGHQCRVIKCGYFHSLEERRAPICTKKTGSRTWFDKQGIQRHWDHTKCSKFHFQEESEKEWRTRTNREIPFDFPKTTSKRHRNPIGNVKKDKFRLRHLYLHRGNEYNKIMIKSYMMRNAHPFLVIFVDPLLDISNTTGDYTNPEEWIEDSIDRDSEDFLRDHLISQEIDFCIRSEPDYGCQTDEASLSDQGSSVGSC